MGFSKENPQECLINTAESIMTYYIGAPYFKSYIFNPDIDRTIGIILENKSSDYGEVLKYLAARDLIAFAEIVSNWHPVLNRVPVSDIMVKLEDLLRSQILARGQEIRQLEALGHQAIVGDIQTEIGFCRALLRDLTTPLDFAKLEILAKDL